MPSTGEAALRAALTRLVENLARGPMARSADVQTPTWQDRARTGFKSTLNADGDEIAFYGLGAYGSSHYAG